MSYLIFADVSIDIDRTFAQENDIRYVPMEYVLGSETFHCAAPESDEMMHQYYERLRQKETTHTSQIVPNHYIEVFEPYIKEGQAILYLALSSGLSDTYNSAQLAAMQLKEKYPQTQIEIVDSLGATVGMGLLTETAAENRKNGMSLAENAQWLREHAGRVHYWFKVEDLMYLKRGGRVSAATAIVGTALNIKPILCINSVGKLETIDKKRGNKQAMKNLLERFEQHFDPAFGKVVYICCADCMEEADKLKQALLEKHPDLTVRKTMLSPIIGAHTGPDMLALVCYGDQR